MGSLCTTAIASCTHAQFGSCVWFLLHAQVAARDDSEPVEAFRQLVGPRDPDLARVLRPHTLRARFGISRVRNSIHCTDLVEDGSLEASYFFSVLQQPTALAH